MALRRITPIPETASGTGWTAKKYGNIVFLRFWAFSGRSIQLPAAFAPVESHSIAYRFGAIDMKPDGLVSITTEDYTGTVYATVNYPLF